MADYPMIRPFFVFCLLLGLSAGAAAGPTTPLTLTLPNTDAYSYWVQSKSGSVTALPVNVSGKNVVKIGATLADGDRLIVLDAHTGQIATGMVAQARPGVPSPISLAVKDFRPLDSPAAPMAASAAPMQSVVKAKEDQPEAGGGVRRLLTSLLSLALAGGVVWFLVHLVKTRGQPLLHLARQAGVEVPDPVAQDKDNVEATVIYTPMRRAPSVVPDEAGLPLPAAGARAHRGPELPMTETPSLVGIQGLVAGGTFGLTGGSVTVGRDGENEIVLAENTVSRYHARIVQDGTGQFVLTDLESANGVFVNGTRVQRAMLTHGDEVKIGDNYFRFQAAKDAQ